FGSLSKSGWSELAIGAPILVAAMIAMSRHGQALNALLLGEAEAGHLGIDVERLKRWLLLLVVLATATCVALAGLIGFVGLLVPQSGDVRLNDRPLPAWTSRERARLRAVLPQQESLRFAFKVADVVALGRLPCETRSPEREAEIVREALAATDAGHLGERIYP